MSNPFITLCQTSAHKNIDSNFVETLQALMFFNEQNLSEKINERYEVKMLVEIDDNTKNSKWLQEKLEHKNAELVKNQDIERFADSLAKSFNTYHSLSYSRYFDRKISTNDTFEVKEDIHIGEFLLNKLSENFRRLYSAHRKGGVTPRSLGSNITNLQEQQKNIYECLELISPNIEFGNEPRIFNNIFFGKVRHCTDAQAFFYLSLHEHLLPDCENKHKQIMLNNFSLDDVDPIIVKEIDRLSYPQEKSKFINEIIQMLPDDFFKEMALYLTDRSIVTGTFMADSFLHCAKNNIEITKEHKAIFLSGLLSQYSHWGKQPASMARDIAKQISEYIKDVPLNKIVSANLSPLLVHKNCAIDLCLLLSEKLTEPDLFLSSLNTNVEPNQKAAIFSKYDFSDQEMLMTIANKISNSGAKKEKMQEFVSIVGDYLENRTIANILALDHSYIEIIKPLYLTRKFQHELTPSAEDQKQNQRKTLKV